MTFNIGDTIKNIHSGTTGTVVAVEHCSKDGKDGRDELDIYYLIITDLTKNGISFDRAWSCSCCQDHFKPPYSLKCISANPPDVCLQLQYKFAWVLQTSTIKD